VPRKLLPVLVALALSAVLALAGPSVAGAQDEPPTAVPVPRIVPRPNTGNEPLDAGDRGGALQLLLPAVLVVVIGGAALHLTRQSRRARSQTG
jgi:hypothetical protein